MWTQTDGPPPSVPFPPVGGVTPVDWPVDELTLRPFGFLAEDREVDFAAPRPRLETHILRCCTQDASGRALPEDFFWSLAVSERTHCLVIIAALDQHAAGLNIELQCPHPECGEHMEINLSLREIIGLRQADDTGPHIRVQLGQESITLRRPTGRDQLAWLRQRFKDEGSAARAMARSLLVDGGGDLRGESAVERDDWVQSASEALAAADPLVDFTVRTACPYCGAEETQYLDLGALALQRLQLARDRLLAAIHTLASRYHWSEEQIMALPSWRRRHYLALIQREDDR